jgi:hypothetical protein
MSQRQTRQEVVLNTVRAGDLGAARCRGRLSRDRAGPDRTTPAGATATAPAANRQNVSRIAIPAPLTPATGRIGETVALPTLAGACAPESRRAVR